MEMRWLWLSGEVVGGCGALDQLAEKRCLGLGYEFSCFTLSRRLLRL